MATNSTVAAGKVAAHNVTLTGTQVDSVTFVDVVRAAAVWTDGTADIYVTLDGSTPTTGGDNTYILKAASGSYYRTFALLGASGAVVKLLSAGTPKYSVEGLTLAMVTA